jgi:hypothetical protein
MLLLPSFLSVPSVVAMTPYTAKYTARNYIHEQAFHSVTPCLKQKSKIPYNIRLRRLVFEIHVTIKMSNTRLSSVICRDDTKSALLRVLQRHTVHSRAHLL